MYEILAETLPESATKKSLKLTTMIVFVGDIFRTFDDIYWMLTLIVSTYRRKHSGDSSVCRKGILIDKHSTKLKVDKT